MSYIMRFTRIGSFVVKNISQNWYIHIRWLCLHAGSVALSHITITGIPPMVCRQHDSNQRTSITSPARFQLRHSGLMTLVITVNVKKNSRVGKFSIFCDFVFITEFSPTPKFLYSTSMKAYKRATNGNGQVYRKCKTPICDAQGQYNKLIS